MHRLTLKFRGVFARLAVAFAAFVGLAAPPVAQAVILLPPGYSATPITPALVEPVAMTFAADGRLFVAEKRGIVKVVVNGVVVSTFINLQKEVNGQGDRGILGIALDPDFAVTRNLWLLYTVDPVYGEPDESAQAPLIGRLVRYTGTAASGGNVADINSRLVVLGNVVGDGLPECWSSHAIGTVRVGADGSLFVGCGDGARFEFADAGGNTPDCVSSGVIPAADDIGAFRSQNINTAAGKILRIDGATGRGLPDNPFFTGDDHDVASKVWAYGLRNPFRFVRKPGSSPGVLYVGDVGWNSFEEVSATSPQGGNNFGWPCFEGFFDAPEYPGLAPASHGCGTLGSPENPGELTAPMMAWSHSDPNLSIPSGFTGNCVSVGALASNAPYAAPYRNGLFIADVIAGWIKLAKIDAADQVTSIVGFATVASQVVDFAIDPATGELCYLSLTDAKAYRIHSTLNPGDVNHNGVVDVDDLFDVIEAWGPCKPPAGQSWCPADLSDDGEIGIDDLFMVINNWG